jgi:hypothetical protein
MEDGNNNIKTWFLIKLVFQYSGFGQFQKKPGTNLLKDLNKKIFNACHPFC